MLLSLNMLSKLVDITNITPEELMLKLTMASAEMEGVTYTNNHLKTIITAKILEVKKHPNADKLTLVNVDTGKETLQVVCGAKNHSQGDIVALATVGTRFSDDFIIQKSKLRGELSSGMLCSEKELGLAESSDGILILPPDTPIGIPLSELYKDAIDVCLEIDNKSITHRPDLWGHLGFAREIGAVFKRPLKDPVDMSLISTFQGNETLKVDIKIPEQAARYCGLVVKNIRIEESPEWLKAHIRSIGMRPINNIVDITNYVMVELGEPMHAFDRKKLEDDTIIVRMATPGEKVTTLDGQEHELSNEDIVIADTHQAVALAGVMGGANSEIDTATTEIVLEAANFDATCIRKTAHRYGLRTDASMRFEKSLDPELCHKAIIRCYQLIKQLIPEVETSSQLIDCYPTKHKKLTVAIHTDYIRASLGIKLSDGKIIDILSSLDYKVTNTGGELNVEVPSYRATKDIELAADIVEEVGRIFGYDNIPPQAPFVPCAPPLENEKRLFERKVKQILSRDHHLIEVSNYSFVGAEILQKLEIDEDKELRLKNPLSKEHDRLRRSLLPNLILNTELNARFNDSFSIFELGRTYLKEDRQSHDLAKENSRISGVVYRKNSAEPLFYQVKNIVVNLLTQLSVADITYLPASEDVPPYAHPGRSMKVMINEQEAGLLTELHPKIKAHCDFKGMCALFDLDLDALLATPKEIRKFRELPKYPTVPFEISVLADTYTYAQTLLDIVNRDYVKNIEVLSIYEGEPIPEGKKSVSLKIVFGADEKTLSHEEIEKLQNNVIRSLQKKGYSLRS